MVKQNAAMRPRAFTGSLLCTRCTQNWGPSRSPSPLAQAPSPQAVHSGRMEATPQVMLALRPAHATPLARTQVPPGVQAPAQVVTWPQ
jgi:hypothetical protein